MDPILVNEILNIKDLGNVKIRFVKKHRESDDPLKLFNNQKDELAEWLLWNYNKKKSFREGDTVIGFIRLDNEKWLLFDIIKITKDLNVRNGVGYEYQPIDKYKKYLGRVIIHYKNKSQNLVRRAESVIDQCSVSQILDNEFNNDLFPGYESVNISWRDLKRLIENSAWKTALENQKGVYLITDKSNGKMYVGSAYGDSMLHGRWSNYAKNGHGGNVELKELNFDHIKENFSYSILDVYKSTVDDKAIIARESWWKETLGTRIHGYNKN